MPVTDSPLRYPGGKTQLTPLVIDVLSVNNLRGGLYAEPFAGGAGIAWKLLLNGDMSEVWLNDIDPAVHALWNAVVSSPDPLCERIRRVDVTIEEWKRQRATLLSGSATTLDLAFATLFLNRTNRSGILKGGVIGGKEQTGNYRLDCRFNKTDLINKIQRIHSYREVVSISRVDARDCIRGWARKFPRRGLINIDPPYFKQGRELYMNYYNEADHKSLANIIQRLRAPWMLTYDDVPQIEHLYAGLPIYRKSLLYYAQVKRRSTELLVLSPHLAAPQTLAFSQVA